MSERSAHDGGPEARPTAQLVRDVADATTRLVRDESRLATAEMRGKTTRVGLGAGLAGVATLCALLAAMALVAAAVLAIALVLPGWLAALIVAGCLTVIAGGAAAVGRVEISRAAPVAPEETVASVHDDIDAVRGSVRR